MNSKVSFDANTKSVKTESADHLAIPVWLHATESFYKKLNRVAKQCGLARYDALSRGLDALLRETEIRNSALNRNIKSASQSEVFRRTMGQVSRNYWASVSPEEKRRRAQNSARARWGRNRTVSHECPANLNQRG
jgi:hypothetical protein